MVTHTHTHTHDSINNLKSILSTFAQYSPLAVTDYNYLLFD